MIHYHGTDLGGGPLDVAKFLQGRHALVPFTNMKDLGAVAEVCASFIFDSGAYSVWTRGHKLDVEGYTRWCEQWYRHPGFDWAIIPDVIEGNEADNDALLRDWPSHLPGVPVWHLHEDIGRLQRLAASYRTVAIGGSPMFKELGSASWWGRVSEAMDALCDEQGHVPCHLHGLRLLDPAIFTRLPLASADSTNVGRHKNDMSRFGQYVPPRYAQRMEVIACRIEALNSPATWQRKGQLGLFEIAA